MKTIAILGSTGSLGRQTLEVLARHQDKVRVVGLLAKQNRRLLESQGQKFNCPTAIAPAFFKADIIVNVVPGLAGIEYTKNALENGSTLLLGNKESLVAEGEEIMKIPSGQIIPIDSEHNAIYEILQNFPGEKIEKLILTASGGPFWGMPKEAIAQMTANEALKHPKWNMGEKVTIESATFINKGLEVIEAQHLFNIPLEKIEVLIHPDCQVHSMVKFEGRDQPIAYIAQPDMKEHIENALMRALGIAPKREMRAIQEGEFKFFPPDHEKFPGLNIVLNAKDKKTFLEKEEKAIEKFLNTNTTTQSLLEDLR